MKGVSVVVMAVVLSFFTVEDVTAAEVFEWEQVSLSSPLLGDALAELQGRFPGIPIEIWKRPLTATEIEVEIYVAYRLYAAAQCSQENLQAIIKAGVQKYIEESEASENV